MTDARIAAMAGIRKMLNRTTTGLEADNPVYVNPMAVRCPFCHAPPAESCTCSGRRVLTRSHAHPSRIEAAAIAQGMTEAAAKAAGTAEQVASVARYRVDHPAERVTIPVASERPEGTMTAAGDAPPDVPGPPKDEGSHE